MQIVAIIEKGKDGFYSIRSEQKVGRYYFGGYGESVKEAKNLKQFICTIAKNEAINFIKQDSRLVKSDLIDEMYGEHDKNNDVLNILEPILSNKEVIVVYYKVIFEMTWDEITRETGIPSSSARLIYKQAKAKLKKELRYVV